MHLPFPLSGEAPIGLGDLANPFIPPAPRFPRLPAFLNATGSLISCGFLLAVIAILAKAFGA